MNSDWITWRHQRLAWLKYFKTLSVVFGSDFRELHFCEADRRKCCFLILWDCVQLRQTLSCCRDQGLPEDELVKDADGCEEHCPLQTWVKLSTKVAQAIWFSVHSSKSREKLTFIYFAANSLLCLQGTRSRLKYTKVECRPVLTRVCFICFVALTPTRPSPPNYCEKMSAWHAKLPLKYLIVLRKCREKMLIRLNARDEQLRWRHWRNGNRKQERFETLLSSIAHCCCWSGVLETFQTLDDKWTSTCFLTVAEAISLH